MSDKRVVERFIEDCRMEWIANQVMSLEWTMPPTWAWLPPWLNTQDHPRQNPPEDPHESQ